MVASYIDEFSNSKAVFLTNYRGLSVADMEKVRARMREVGGTFRIAKNTLAVHALKATGLPVPEEMLKGPTALGFAYDEVPSVAKALADFAKETQIFEVKGGVLDGKILSSAEVTSLADLPPREVLFAQLLGLIQQPGNQVAGVINAAGNKLAATIKAYVDKLGEAEATA